MFYISCYYTEIHLLNSSCLIKLNLSKIVSLAFCDLSRQIWDDKSRNLTFILHELDEFDLVYYDSDCYASITCSASITYCLALQICAADFLSQQEEKKPGRCRSNQRRPQVAVNFSALLIINTENLMVIWEFRLLL